MFPSPSTNVGRNRPADTPPFCCRKGRPMLQLINIEKKYTTGDLTQAALNGVSLNLRDSEFVAILGPSGSGKTTLLNIIGGLDRYDNGELIIPPPLHRPGLGLLPQPHRRLRVPEL
jgi:ABC-type nitrate/sulfonate/bicarbonate transport system ATPase subunit